MRQLGVVDGELFDLRLEAVFRVVLGDYVGPDPFAYELLEGLRDTEFRPSLVIRSHETVIETGELLFPQVFVYVRFLAGLERVELNKLVAGADSGHTPTRNCFGAVVKEKGHDQIVAIAVFVLLDYDFFARTGIRPGHRAWAAGVYLTKITLKVNRFF